MNSPFTSRKNESQIRITDKLEIQPNKNQLNLRKYLTKKNESTLFAEDPNKNKFSKRMINKN